MAEQTKPILQPPRAGLLSRMRREPSPLARRRFGLRRAGLTLVAFAFSAIGLAAVLAATVFVMLTTGTITIDLSGQIARALNERVGGGYAFALGATSIQETSHGPTLAIDALAVRDGRGRTVIAAPHASLSVDPFALLFGRVSPKRLELQDVVLRLERLSDGSIAVSAGADQPADTKLSAIVSTLSTAHDASPGLASTPATPGPQASPVGTSPSASLPDVVAKAVSAACDQLFGDSGPLHAVDRLGLSNGTLVVNDRLRGKSLSYTGVTVDFDREDSGGVYVTMGAEGPAGHWSGAARAHRLPDGSRSIDLAADHLSSDEINLAAGLRAAKFETDMPLSFSLSAEVGPDGRLRRAGGPVAFGTGYFKLDDPDHEPAMVDKIEAALTMDPATGAFAFDTGTLVAEATHFAFGLTVAPPTEDDGPWRIGGHASGSFGPERPGEQPIAFDAISFGARFLPSARQLVLEDARARGPDVDFHMNATFQANDDGFWVKSGMEMGHMPGMAVIRLWPNWVAAPVRAWLLRNLHGGTFEWGKGQLYLTDVDLEKMRNQRSVPDDHVRIEFGVANGNLVFMDGVPPLRGLDATGLITGDSFTLKASKAEMEVTPGHKLSATEGVFTVPSTDPKPTPAGVTLHVTGAIDTLSTLLSHDALKPFADLPIDASAVSGGFDGRLTLNFKIGPHVPKEDTTIGVVATVKDFSASKVIGKEPLQGATLAVTADRSGLHAKGEGRMFGAPATIDLRKPAGGPSEASVGLTLDDAARQKAGFGFGRSVTGPMTAKITTQINGNEKTRASVLLDFTRCAFDAPIPGLRKAVDRPSKATFTATTDNNRTQLDQIVFDSGSTAIRGSAVLDGNGGLATASLSQLRLSPGDDARVEISRAGDGLKVVVRGTNIDARPFLKYATGEQGAGEGGGRDIDLDLHANLLTGQNAQALSAVDLRLVKRGSQVRRLQVSGRLGHGTVTASTASAGQVVVAAKDAGAVLSFLDLYNRMDGGQLDATLKFGDSRMDGTAVVHNFTIREDPSIKKLAQEEVPSGNRNSGSRIDPSAVSFTKLEAVFSRVGNKVDVRQGAMFGPQLGATVEGTIDFGHDKVALSGTFVPLYGLNNLFSQIPVVGLLLGGGAHEGLFALNYRIVGSASAPVLSFNPLSALAPGFLRKIFGAIDNAAQQGLDGQAHDAGAAPAIPE